MELNDNFRKDWIDFMSSKIECVFTINLYIPDSLKHILQKCPAKFKVDVKVIQKFSRSVKVQYNLFGNIFEEIIYIPTSKSVQQIIDDTNNKIGNKVNNWLKENQNTFVENEYKKYGDTFKNSIKKMQFERLQKQREEKLKKIIDERF